MNEPERPSAAPAHPFPTTKQRLSRTGRTYRLSAVGFIDTLGAKAFAASEQFMNALAFMVDLHESIAATRPSTNPVRVTYFSDNVGASIVLDGLPDGDRQRAVCQLLRLLAGIQLQYLQEFGILCRGGVAIGGCFHSENVIFGPALVEAYALETIATTPRIAVSAAVAALAGGDIVPLLPPEPLLNREGTVTGTARSIDFIRAELPDPGFRSGYLATLQVAIARGAAGLTGDVGAKWEWTRRRLDELTAELGAD